MDKTFHRAYKPDFESMRQKIRYHQNDQLFLKRYIFDCSLINGFTEPNIILLALEKPPGPFFVEVEH